MSQKPNAITPSQLAACIDHTLLQPEAGGNQIEALCGEAVHYGFAAVCVHPCHVETACRCLASHPVRAGTVAGFPFGANHTKIKHAETLQALEDGAEEVDMVVNLAAALAGDTHYLKKDIHAVLRPCHGLHPPRIVKLILETAALPRETKIMLCRLASDLGVDYIKTSTGLHPAGGATLDDVKLLYANRGRCKVKAAGGIRNLKTTLDMIHAGAERIGTSAGVKIMQQLLQNRPETNSPFTNKSQ